MKYQFATEVFKTEYKKRSFEKYSGRVEVTDKNTLKFGEKTLLVSAEDTTLMLIFKKAIFNPDAVFGKQTTKPPRNGMNVEQKIFYNMGRNDSLYISSVEELERLNPNRKTKRFKFWLFRLRMANPQECYFELFNSKATKNTTWGKFLENAEMTFYYAGTIII